MQNSHQHGIGKEHPQSHLIQAGCGLAFLIIWLLDLILVQLPNDILISNLLIIQILLFLIFLILAVRFGMTSHNRLFGGVNQPSRLISDDVFAVVRHPMYFGTLVLYLGLIFLSLSVISVIPWIITFILYNKIAIFEEKELERIFGNEYFEYQKEVPRWIPNPSSLLKLFFKSNTS
ncbi:MAG: methyltransferase family protein [Promethearchaeota archaeon]